MFLSCFMWVHIIIFKFIGKWLKNTQLDGENGKPKAVFLTRNKQRRKQRQGNSIIKREIWSWKHWLCLNNIYDMVTIM